MECAENNSFIITLSIIAHGAVEKIKKIIKLKNIIKKNTITTKLTNQEKT